MFSYEFNFEDDVFVGGKINGKEIKEKDLKTLKQFFTTLSNNKSLVAKKLDSIDKEIDAMLEKKEKIISDYNKYVSNIDLESLGKVFKSYRNKERKFKKSEYLEPTTFKGDIDRNFYWSNIWYN